MMNEQYKVLGVPVNPITLDGAVTFLLEKTSAPKFQVGFVIFRDVHGLIRCQDDAKLLKIHQNSLLVCPDGMPLVWIGRLKGYKKMTRVYGPDLMRSLMHATRDGKKTHFLYGGKPGVADLLKKHLESQYPGVRIVGVFTPPFGSLSEADTQALQESIQQLQPDFFWVGLSTPKQEYFMQEYLECLDIKVMLGVGAAFDYLSGEVKEPPVWVQRIGLQWLWRIGQEPGRLAGRYAQTVPRFLWLLFKEQLH